MDLVQLGWDSFFEKGYKEFIENNAKENNNYKIARIFGEARGFYKIYTEDGDYLAEVSGKMRFQSDERQDYPAIGDWVIASIRGKQENAIIHGILPRKSKFSRKEAGLKTNEQILTANVDTVFLVNALNNNFNVRRIERYLILAWESGAVPVIVLSKADLCEDIDQKVNEVELSAAGVPCYAVSTVTGQGIDELKKYFGEGKTVSLLGSSGVGKSTLINYLMEKEVQKTNSTRESDDRGRHTSTSREMFFIPEGGLIVDTPGMRELQLWNGDEGISETFTDIEELSKQCRFRDCTHENEPGCAVREAIEQGIISAERLANYRKLQKELRHIHKRQDAMARIAEKKQHKSKSKYDRRHAEGYEY